MGNNVDLDYVKAARAGDELAYEFLIDALSGLIYDTYFRFLQSRMRSDDWYSEGLWVLMACVKHYNLEAATARFTTYFTQALRNRAKDILRQSLTQKALFEAEMVRDQPTVAFEGGLFENVPDYNVNPEQQLMMKQTFHEMYGDMSLRQRQMLLALLTRRKLSDLQKRQTTQLRYRTMRLVREKLA